MKKRLRMRAGLMVILLVAIALLTVACEGSSNNPPSAMCGYVIGNGEGGNDTRVHSIVWPNQNVDYDSDNEEVKYVPCNSRNYLINSGTEVNANGDKVGDRFTPTLAYTSTGTPVKIWSSSYWTLNQDKQALEKFYEFCYKYTCASSNSNAGNANFSTRGWNGMLGENFGPSVDAAALTAAAGISDDIWRKHDAALYEQLGKQMSAVFAEKVRAKTGYNLDLFCGSGNSGFKDPGSHKGFLCTNVRIVIDRVEPVDAGLGNQSTAATKAEQEKTLNAERLAAARELYGDQAAFWIGLQDTIEKCKAQGTSCVVNIGGSGSTVSVPVPK